MKNKTALCTISANNFMPYGLDCLYSVKKYNDYDLYYLVADEYRDELYVNYKEDINFIKLDDINISLEELLQMKYKYSLVEFNTSVKPAFYNYLFEKGYENVIYFDPDFKCYNNLKYLDEELEHSSIVLTPHKLTMKDNPLIPDNDILSNGLFNLGFIGMHRCEETLSFLNWWNEKLRDECYLDYLKGNATDQIWCNFVPILCANSKILRHPGMNVAFWNITERQVEINDEIMINGEKLLFINFSSL